MKLKPKFSNNKPEIVKAFSVKGGVYDKIDKNCPAYRPIFDMLMNNIILISILLNYPAIGIHYNTEKCFCIKREFWHIAELYGYKHLFDILGITYTTTQKYIGFSGFHSSSTKISATFREAVLAHYINLENSVDEDYSLSLTINYSKNSGSYSLFVTDDFQNGILNMLYKEIAKKAAPLFKGRILAKYNLKAKETQRWYNSKLNAKNKGYRKTTHIAGAVKTDIYDILTGEGISLKETNSSQLCSQSPEETITMFQYIKETTNNPALKNRIDELIKLFDYSNICCRVFNELISVIKDNGKHKYHNLVKEYDDRHKIITAQIVNTCIEFPEFRYKVYRDAILGESKFEIGCNAIPNYMFHCNTANTNDFELLTPEEFLEKHMDDISINVSWKSSTPKAYAYTSLRIYFNPKTKKAS